MLLFLFLGDGVMILAKCKCFEVQTTKADGVVTSETINLIPVVPDCPGNKEWSKWIPSGNLSLTITNPAAFGKFVEGKEYFVDFTPVE